MFHQPARPTRASVGLRGQPSGDPIATASITVCTRLKAAGLPVIPAFVVIEAEATAMTIVR